MQLISEIMTYDATFVPSAHTVRQALQTMDAWNIHAVPVCDDAHLIGMFSRQDLGSDPHPGDAVLNQPVAAFMNAPVICCYEDQPVDDALDQMSRHRIRHLPILNRKQELIGMLSLTDVANRIVGLPQQRAQELLHAFGPEQLSSNALRSHRLASGTADGKF